MDFVNETNVAAGWTMGFDRDGRELIVVAIKATFVIPRDAAQPGLADEQVPLTEADEFTGKPGMSAPLYETDFAHRKPKCDVLLNGSAYAPPGRMARRMDAGFAVGAVSKALAVVGNRVWRDGLAGLGASGPQAFGVMPISYDNAYGGVDDGEGDPASIRTFLENPVGQGYWHSKNKIRGKPLPNTEQLDNPITGPNGGYRPMAFGPIGRNWQPRVKHTGTYDEKWLDERAPFWPADFDYQYFQAAPPDQQMPYPSGGEDVVLRNLTPDGDVSFRLPSLSMPVWFLPYQGQDERVNAVIDTVLLEPDLGRFMLVWRAALPMRRSCFDVRQIIAGHRSEAWQRARRSGGKPYYQGLAELVRARQGSK